jgi:hypothetical protein
MAFDIDAEIQKADRDIARTTDERDKIQRGLTETTSKQNDQIAKLNAQITQYAVGRQRLLDMKSFDQRLAELNALRATHAVCVSTANGLTAARDAALADAAAKAAQVTALTGTVAARDTTIIVLNGTVEARDEQIVTLNNTVATMQAQIDALLAQLPPTETFFAFDQARIGDISAQGFAPLLTVYQASMVAPGEVTTDPPNVAFLDTFFANLFQTHGNVRLCLDHEAWPLITDVNSATGVSAQVVGWYVTLVTRAKLAGFTDVGLYGEICERHSIYLNYPVGHSIHTTRKNNWFARSELMQPIWDVVTTVYPSFYFIKPIHNDAAKFDMWVTDSAALCALHAPGKKVYPFLLARIHPTADPLEPWVDADYWGHALDKMRDLFDGYTLWLDSSEVMATVTAQPWWTRTLEKHAAWELT